MKKIEKLYLADVRRKQIVETAINCFSQNGFHGTSMSELLTKSGLGAGQLYRYFPSKDAIILEVVKSIARDWSDFLSSHLNRDTTLQDILNIKSEFWAEWDDIKHSLLLESYCEASRNDNVRKILKAEEEKTIDYLIKNKSTTLNESKTCFNNERVRLLLTIIDGFICRVVYDLNLDQQELSRLDILVFGERK